MYTADFCVSEKFEDAQKYTMYRTYRIYFKHVENLNSIQKSIQSI